MAGQVIWITGLSGAGKTTLAEQLDVYLQELGLKVILLDGDLLRILFLDANLKSASYTREERIKLALKYSYLCKTLSAQGFNIIIATISMFNEVYDWNRENITNYFEVYLKVPLKELRHRDPKFIYKRYDDGDLRNVAGLDLKVDEPLKSHLTLDFESQPLIWESIEYSAKHFLSKLEKTKFGQKCQ
jgi:adenylylsulfate kinase